MDTFGNNPEFVIAFASLGGSLLVFFFFCLAVSLILRRKRFLSELVQGNGTRYPITEASPVYLRDSSRTGALSFDGRDGWRSDAELRISARSGSNRG